MDPSGKKYQHNTIIVLKTDCYCTQREEDMAPLLIMNLQQTLSQ